MKSIISITFFGLFTLFSQAQQTKIKFQDLAQPDTSKVWIQPTQGKPAMAIWGHAKGISIGIPQLNIMPRGLIRIFTPYLDHPQHTVTNFIAMEPIAVGQEHRGLSELEMSSWDPDIRGKRFWSSNNTDNFSNDNEISPVRGVIEKEDGIETLSVYIFSEPFDNGAKVYVRLRFFENRPYEFELTSYTYENSVELNSFVLTATMGNKARLRTLHLDSYNKSAVDIWPNYQDDGFTPHAFFPVKDMIKDTKGSIHVDQVCFMREPVYHCRHQHFIFYYFSPSVESKVCSDDCGLFSCSQGELIKK